MKNTERFKKQIEFILEVDKLKHVRRRSILLDRSRRENSAEHSWHIALGVLVLAEYAEKMDLDFLRVIKMLLIHDLVEIDAGDTYCYDDQGRKSQAQREKKAAGRIFGILPADQATALRMLWDEFEAQHTAESRFANALDRLLPLLHNYFTDGRSWRQHGVQSEQVMARMRPVARGAPLLWAYAVGLIEDAVNKGFLKN